jgi:DNA polymerase III delta prime subunit
MPYDDDRAVARRDDPSTSHRAAAGVNVTKREQDVVDVLWRYPKGLTTHEISDSSKGKIPWGSTSPRMKRLEGKGVVVRLAERRGSPGWPDPSEVWRIRREGERMTTKDTPLEDFETRFASVYTASRREEKSVKTHKERVRIDDAPDNVIPLRHKKSKESLLTRYRPTSFEKVLGQEDVIAGLKSAIKQTNAFILSGMSGVGKTTVARLAAKLLLKCHKDNIHEIDAARFSGVEAMSEIIDKLDHLPLLSTGPIVFIIDECQRLSREAWTMLLKTLEESPPDVYWFFCTTELARVPVNIRDQRCTVFHLQAVSRNSIIDYIWDIADLEQLATPDEVLALCAQQALGAPRRALSFLTACSHCETRDEAARVLNIAAAKDQSPDGLGFHLARLLVTPKWREVRLQLKKIRETKTHPEGVRLVVRAYFSKVLDDEDDERAVCYALKVLDCFSDPMTDHTELQQACGRVVFGGTNDQ